MALVTRWVKRLSQRLRQYEATVIASDDKEHVELLIHSQGRTLRCHLNLHDVTTLYGSILNSMSKATKEGGDCVRNRHARRPSGSNARIPRRFSPL
jgi:hypothetical protein